MPNISFRNRPLAIVAAMVLAVAPAAHAQTFPNRPITIVVPFAPGGAADILGRAIAERMAQALRQPVLVENKAGAGGNIAAQAVAKAAPDGYTMLLAGTTTLVLQPLLSSKLSFDVERDFTGVGMLASAPLVIVVSAQSPVGTVDGLINAAKARPGTMNLGSSGNGSTMHVAGALFESMAGIDLLHVPYKGSPPALNALMAGEIQVLFDLVASAKPLVDNGRLKPLAVTSESRSSALPNVPTLQESGFKDYDLAARYALVVPKQTPADVIATLNRAANEALRDPNLSNQLKALTLEVAPGPTNAVAAYAARERGRLGPVIAAKRIKMDD